MSNQSEDEKKGSVAPPPPPPPSGGDDDDGVLDLRALAASSIVPSAIEPEKKGAASDDDTKVDLQELSTQLSTGAKAEERKRASEPAEKKKKAEAEPTEKKKAEAEPTEKKKAEAEPTEKKKAEAEPAEKKTTSSTTKSERKPVIVAAAPEKSNTGMLLGVALVALLAVGGFAYLKMSKGQDDRTVASAERAGRGAPPGDITEPPPLGTAPPGTSTPASGAGAQPDTTMPRATASGTGATASGTDAPPSAAGTGTVPLAGTSPSAAHDVQGTSAVDTAAGTGRVPRVHAPRASGVGRPVSAANVRPVADTHAVADTHVAVADTHAADTHAAAGHGIDTLLDRALGGHPAGGGTHTEPVADAHAAGGGSTDGSLPETPPQADVARAMVRLTSGIRQCAGDQVGTALLSVILKNDGSVGSVTVGGSPFQGTPQGACMEGVVRRATFPRFHQTTFRFSYPFAVRAM